MSRKAGQEKLKRHDKAYVVNLLTKGGQKMTKFCLRSLWMPPNDKRWLQPYGLFTLFWFIGYAKFM